MGMDLALVLIGGEETDHPSRHHAAQVTEDATRLIHLGREDKEPTTEPFLKPPKKAQSQVQRPTGDCGEHGQVAPRGGMCHPPHHTPADASGAW